MIGNGLADLQRYDEASQFFSRALHLAANTNDIGFPFIMLSVRHLGDNTVALQHAFDVEFLGWIAVRVPGTRVSRKPCLPGGDCSCRRNALKTARLPFQRLPNSRGPMIASAGAIE